MIRLCVCNLDIHVKCWKRWIDRDIGWPPEMNRGTDSLSSYLFRKRAADMAHENTRHQCIACKLPTDRGLLEVATVTEH